MSTPARIDELRKKFDENPRRYFAPLANEYRKAGDLAQAIALCREGLPKQPGHMSGHIVYGQALYEAGELGQARTVFESALALDPENLIALRHLGDIAKASGDASTARRWYERVLDADPRNDDIAAQLATLGAGTPARPMPAVAPAPVVESDVSLDVPADGGPALTPPFGMGALPTPDAAMRAVDFDVVNAQIARYTPLDLDAIESSTDRTPAASHAGTAYAAPVEGAGMPETHAVSEVHEPGPTLRSFEPLDLDAMDAAFVRPAGDAVDEREAQREAERASDVGAETTFAKPTAELHVPATVESHAALEVKTDTDPEAPLETPSAMDDAFVSAASAAAADSGEYMAPASADSTFSSSAADDTAVEFEEGIFAPEWHADTADIIASIATPRHVTPIMASPAIAEPSEDAALAFGREANDAALDTDDADNASYDFDAGAIDGDDGSVSDGDGVTAASTEDPADERAEEVAPMLESVDDIAAEATLDNEAPARLDEGESDVPSLAWDDAPNEFTQEFAPEIAERFSADALEEVAEGATVEAWNDALDEPAGIAPAPMPAFATETMGELLVSQGFIQRAADVYEELVRRRPYDPVLTSRLAELRERLAAADQLDETTPRSVVEEHAAAQLTASHPTPEHVSPVHTESVRNTPLRSTPLRSTPLRSTPVRALLRTTPLRPTPLRGVVPVDQFSRADEGEQVTAHELFARIAARRVPRRTPPQAMPLVAPDAPDGLSSLFGGSEAGHDDVAARALADAFAPISAQDMASGSTLDLDFGNPPVPSHTSTSPFSHASVQPSPASEQSTAVPTTANAGFSFDRFFPDPARATTGTPSAAAPTPMSASSPSPASADADVNPSPTKATEDLAQFSAWLKGLGGS